MLHATLARKHGSNICIRSRMLVSTETAGGGGTVIQSRQEKCVGKSVK